MRFRRCFVSSAALFVLWSSIAFAQFPDESSLPNDNGESVDRLIEIIKEQAVPRWYVTLAAMFGALAVLALLGVGNRQGKSRAGANAGPQLPEELRAVSVLGARYRLDTFSGVIASITTTIDVKVTTTFTGGTYHYGHMPWTATTETKTTRRQVFWLRLDDNTEQAWDVVDMDFPAAAGHVVSFVGRPRKSGGYDCLLGYNHTSRGLTPFNYFGAHRIGGRLSWLAAVTVGVLGLLWSWQAVWTVMIAEAGSPPWATDAAPVSFVTIALCAAVSALVAILPFGLVQFLFVRLRKAAFNSSYVPRIRVALEAISAQLRRPNAA